MREYLYSRGSSIQELIGECEAEADVAGHVFVRGNLTCTTPVETSYYSASCFPLVCMQCAKTDDIIHGDGVSHMQTCSDCLVRKPRISKRKKVQVCGTAFKKAKKSASLASAKS